MIKTIIKNLFGLSKPLTVGTSNERVRENWIKVKLANVPSGYRILDAGAGEQPFKKFCTHLDYVSQDFNGYDPGKSIGLQVPGWDYGSLDIISDIATIPEPDTSFDTILCTEVLEHIINPREAIKEFARLLKPGGYLILTSPFASLTHFAPYHFYSGFNRFFYEEVLTENNFQITEITPNGNYFEFLAQELNRVNGVASDHAKQKFTRKEMLASKIVSKALERFSEKDSSSAELLNLGLHVVAKKK